MEASLDIPLKNYADERTVQRTVPAWVRKIHLELARCTTADPTIWPNQATHVNVEVEASFDDGATWVLSGAWGAFGGIFLRRDGSEALVSSADFPHPGGGLARINFTVTNGPCRTQGQIKVTDT